MSGDWGQSGIPHLARVGLMKCYYMLQNARVTAFTVSEFLTENHQIGGKIIPPTQIRINRISKNKHFFVKNISENVVETLVLDLFLFFKKALYESKWSGA